MLASVINSLKGEYLRRPDNTTCSEQPIYLSKTVLVHPITCGYANKLHLRELQCAGLHLCFQ